MVNAKHTKELTEDLDEIVLMNSITKIASSSLLEPLKRKYEKGDILILGDNYWRIMTLIEQRIQTDLI